jgi:hypothetical protein
MNIYYTLAFTIVSTITNADANGMVRGLHRGGGGQGPFGLGKHGGPPPFAMIEDECGVYNCEAPDVVNLDCNIEAPERPEGIDPSTMTDEEKQEARSKMEDAREAHHQQVVKCACCDKIPLEELLPPREGFGHGNHGYHKGPPPFLQEMVEEECLLQTCDDLGEEEIDCDIQMPARPDLTGLSDEEKQDLWNEMKATRKAHHQQIVRCACCTKANLEDLLPRDGAIGSGFGSSTSEDDGEGISSSEDGVQASNRLSGSRPMGAGGSGPGGGPGNGHGKLGGGAGRPGGMKVQHMMDEHCPNFTCPDDSEGNACTMLDSTAAREERRENVLKCVCCQDDGVAELQDENEEDVSVLLASLLTNESEVQTEESFLSNPASHAVLSLASMMAAFGGVLAIA